MEGQMVNPRLEQELQVHAPTHRLGRINPDETLSASPD
jgi:hypothetical protein